MKTPLRVLLVDDDTNLRMTLAAALEDAGYIVAEAEDGGQTVELARTQEFDLVLTDVQMPKMDGWHALDELRRIRPTLPVVMMTALPTQELLDDAVSRGAYTIAQKPVQPEQLLMVLARAAHRPAVLVVDDSGPTVETLLGVLDAAGLRAKAALSGDEALDLLEDAEIDVCVLDLLMPGRDGIATCQEIRNRFKDTAVLGITASKDEVRIAQFIEGGAMLCLRKPIGVDTLLGAIGFARLGAASARVLSGES